MELQIWKNLSLLLHLPSSAPGKEVARKYVVPLLSIHWFISYMIFSNYLVSMESDIILRWPRILWHDFQGLLTFLLMGVTSPTLNHIASTWSIHFSMQQLKHSSSSIGPLLTLLLPSNEGRGKRRELYARRSKIGSRKELEEKGK